jgi:ABC-type phosphate transport system substrate-binding protein
MKNILKGRVERLAAVAALAVALGAGVLAQGKITINGAGATFPYIIYSKWFSEYNKMHPEVQINYQSQVPVSASSRSRSRPSSSAPPTGR